MIVGVLLIILILLVVMCANLNNNRLRVSDETFMKGYNGYYNLRVNEPFRMIKAYRAIDIGVFVVCDTPEQARSVILSTYQYSGCFKDVVRQGSFKCDGGKIYLQARWDKIIDEKNFDYYYCQVYRYEKVLNVKPVDLEL